MKKAVTIAIPVFNSAVTIKRTLLSALNQTFPNIDYLIIDDKGTDGSLCRINDIISSHPRGGDVRIIDHIVNKGIGATKNTAIDNADSEFLFFLDSDDVITPDCIQKLYDAGKNKDCCYASYMIFSSDMKHIGGHTLKRSFDRKAVPSLAHSLFWQGRCLYTPTWNKLYRVSFLQENHILCTPNTNVDDMFFTFQIAFHCKKFYTIPDVTYYYLLNNSSMTSGMGALRYDYALQLTSACNDMQRFLAANDSGELQWGYESMLCESVKWVVKKVLKSSILTESQKEYLIQDRCDSLRRLGQSSRYNQALACLFFSDNYMDKAQEIIDFRTYTPVKKWQKDNMCFKARNMIVNAMSMFKYGLPKSYRTLAQTIAIGNDSN